MGTKLPLISVITTVYNTEKYVERCFDSVLNQSYKNIEFIVVDNGSSGDITEIVLQYQTAYPNHMIKLVSLKENVGLFHARLIGSKNASGDYIAFIDSDDRVSLDFYRALLKKAITTESDMVATDFVYEDESGKLSRDIYNPISTFSFEWTQTSVYKGYKQDKIEMRGDRAEMSDFPLYLNTVAGGLDRRDQTIGGFSFVVKIYAVPVVEIIG